jgi:hypothetical protein
MRIYTVGSICGGDQKRDRWLDLVNFVAITATFFVYRDTTEKHK